jgi:hypothetical protein
MLLNEITVRQITQNNYTGFPTTKKRQHIVNTVNARDIKFTPYSETNNLKVESDTQSSGSDHYDTFIQFDDVQFLEEGGIAFRGTDNQNHHITPLNARHNDIEVNCECLDFRFRFANYHYNNDSLLGNPPPPYIKKTDRPPVNPKKALGSCKHVLALVNKLTQLRILRWD